MKPLGNERGFTNSPYRVGLGGYANPLYRGNFAKTCTHICSIQSFPADIGALRNLTKLLFGGDFEGLHKALYREIFVKPL